MKKKEKKQNMVKETKDIKGVDPRAMMVFNKVRELLNLPTRIVEKKKVNHITVFAEKFEVGGLSFAIDEKTGNVLIGDMSGVFSLNAVWKSLRSFLREIRKNNRLLAKEERKAEKAKRKEERAKRKEERAKAKAERKAAREEKKKKKEKDKKKNKTKK